MLSLEELTGIYCHEDQKTYLFNKVSWITVARSLIDKADYTAEEIQYTLIQLHESVLFPSLKLIAILYLSFVKKRFAFFHIWLTSFCTSYESTVSLLISSVLNIGKVICGFPRTQKPFNIGSANKPDIFWKPAKLGAWFLLPVQAWLYYILEGNGEAG